MQLHEMIDYMYEMVVQVGSYVIREGEDDKRLFVLAGS